MKNTFLLFFIVLSLSVQAQIPNGYYSGTEGLSGDALKTKLHTIIDDHIEYSYNDLRDFILKQTDEDPNNSNNVILLYTGRSQSKSSFGGGANDWNREHVWAKSHGGFGNNRPAGTDAHHIRPTDASVNSSRGNLDFDDGGQPHNEATECHYDNNSWEPRDEVKGDVARMIFYMAVRYEGDDGVPDLEVVDNVNTGSNPIHGKLSTLLEWHNEDPPSEFERNRNEVIYGYQENRNPFIDIPDFANKIWGNPNDVNDIENPIVKLYPNPTKDFLFLEFNNRDVIKDGIEIYSINGSQEKVSYTIDSLKATINTQCLLPGLYTVMLTSNKGKLFALRFIKL